jgi:hypothetical protein
LFLGATSPIKSHILRFDGSPSHRC